MNIILYIAIIGDIKKSKEIEERYVIQNKLTNVLNEINQLYCEDIEADFTVTLGDEFQGLLCRGIHVLDILEYIQTEMEPVELRFGIGIGKIVTPINPEQALGADGPAYYRARTAITKVKKREKQKQSARTDIAIELDEKHNEVEALLNVALSMIELIRDKWTVRQKEIISDYEFHLDGQETCAARLGIAQSTVQRSLKAGNYYLYKESKDAFNKLLEEIRSQNV